MPFFVTVLIIAFVVFYVSLVIAKRVGEKLPEGVLAANASSPKYYGACGVFLVCVMFIVTFNAVTYFSSSVEPAVEREEVWATADDTASKWGDEAANSWGEEPVPLVSTIDIVPLIISATVALIVFGLYIARVRRKFHARRYFEGGVRAMLGGSALISITITLLIVLSVLYEASRFFDKIPIIDFLFGLHWSPQISIHADQAGSSGSFGAVPVFAGTLLITFVAMMVAAPLGLFSAIFLSEYAHKRVRAAVKPVLEVLAGIPTVVYGYFAVTTVSPWLKDVTQGWDLGVISLVASPESAMAAGLVMGIMIIPFVLSLSDDVMSAVPNSLREASYGLGATKNETIRKVVIPAALPGVVGALLLAISRGIGETMIVVMAAGLAANLTLNPMESVTTVTAQIVTLLTGDQEFDSAKTLAAFALSLALFVITLTLNVIALLVVKKYRERYE